jgi:hypothetical protein
LGDERAVADGESILCLLPYRRIHGDDHSPVKHTARTDLGDASGADTGGSAAGYFHDRR